MKDFRFQVLMASLYTVKAFIVLDSDGVRLTAKYYSSEWPTLDKQRSLEEELHKKAQSNREAEILLVENIIAVFTAVDDLLFFLVGSLEENELILTTILTTYMEALSLIFKNQLDKQNLSENIEFALFALDELLDEGVLMECEPQVIADKACLKAENPDDKFIKMPMNAVSSAREFVTKNLGEIPMFSNLG